MVGWKELHQAHNEVIGATEKTEPLKRLRNRDYFTHRVGCGKTDN
jgi:hypothetical protein